MRDAWANSMPWMFWKPRKASNPDVSGKNYFLERSKIWRMNWLVQRLSKGILGGENCQIKVWLCIWQTQLLGDCCGREEAWEDFPWGKENYRRQDRREQHKPAFEHCTDVCIRFLKILYSIFADIHLLVNSFQIHSLIPCLSLITIKSSHTITEWSIKFFF